MSLPLLSLLFEDKTEKYDGCFLELFAINEISLCCSGHLVPMEGYYMESPSDHKRTISLNLADLKSDTENIHNPNLRRGLYSDITPALAHPDEFLKKSIRDITKQESSYQQNFSVLLSKSKGTKYEPVLRKLMNMECVEVIYSPHKSAKLASEPSHLKAGVPPTKQVIQTLAPKRSIYEQQQTSKFLAQPVARKIWKVAFISFVLTFSFN